MIDLSNVTLVNIDSAADYYSKSNIRLATISRIVPDILKKIQFGDVLMINPFGKNKNLLSYDFEPLWKEIGQEGKTAPLNINWYSNFLIKRLPFLIKTEWYLIIQWDGFPISPNSWSNDFFNYPYLGGGHSLINGGFSLRNTETMLKISQINNSFDAGSEDVFYSCFFDNEWNVNKQTPFKIRWPDEKTVSKFCFWNNENKDIEYFGWHRSENIPKVYMNMFFEKTKLFSKQELRLLSAYLSYKEMFFEFDGIDTEKLLKNFEMNYNDEFFNMY